MARVAAELINKEDDSWMAPGSANRRSDLALTMLVAGEDPDIIGKNTWLGDTGASCSMTNSMEGMYDIKDIKSKVKVGSGVTLMATKIGKKKVTVVQKDGATQDVTLLNVKYVPGLWVNLLSIGQAIQNGFSISNKGLIITLKKGTTEIKFDRIIPTQQGFVIGVEIRARTDPGVAAAVMDVGSSVDINKAHAMLGHTSMASVKKTAEALGWALTGTEMPCQDCAKAKAKQMKIPKKSGNNSNTPCERLCIDISSIRGSSFGGAKYWILVVDEATDYCWSEFVAYKSDLSGKMIALVKEINGQVGRKVTYIRCDNAGENQAFERAAKSEGLQLTFEYTAPGTPQQNGKVERKFAMLYGRVRAMLNAACLTKALRHGLWAEAARTATLLENATVSTHETTTAYYKIHNKHPNFVKHLRTFGEVAIVRDHATSKIKGKLENRGLEGIFLGYAMNHDANVYRLLKLANNRVILSRDLIWLDQTYGQYKHIHTRTTVPPNDSDSDDDITTPPDGDADAGREEAVVNNAPVVDPADDDEADGTETGNDDEENDDEGDGDDNDIVPPSAPAPNAKVIREMKKLGGFFNPEAEAVVMQHQNQNELLTEQGNAMMDLVELGLVAKDDDEAMGGDEAPSSFRDAWDHPDPEKRSKWRAAIQKEFHDMNRRKVWRKIKRADIPKGRRCVKHKWVLKVKRNGVYIAHVSLHVVIAKFRALIFLKITPRLFMMLLIGLC